MGMLKTFRRARPDSTASVGSDNENSSPRTEEKAATDESNVVRNSEDGDQVQLAQDGVKKAQATTIVWTRKALIISYGLIFLIFFMNSLGQQVSGALLAYVTSDFQQHSLIPVTNVVSQLVASVIKLPVAKLMDIWGRPQGFVLMLFCAVMGLIMMAATNGVTTYAAAQVFYWVGENGIAYVLDVFIADTSSLKWRGLMFAFSTSPYIATVFAGPAAGQAYYVHSTWRWAYGTWTIVTPAICMPFLLVFWYNQRLAKKQGLLVLGREASGRTWWQSVQHYLIEFDFIGMVLLIAGWSLMLLPLNLANNYVASWGSSSVIAMLVVGFCCLVGFGVHERFFAKRSFLPFHFLIDRTVIGACMMAGTLFCSFYCWDLYFTSYLQVVYNLSIQDAGYVYNIYNIGSCFWSIVTGLLIPVTNHFKWLAMCAVPLQILGTGLMIHFRQPDQGLGLMIMCQIFIAISGGTLVVTEQLAIMAAVGPENVAVSLALLALFTAIGGAIGTSISGAIWTNTLPGELQRYLPDNLKDQAATIYEDITVQLDYPVGSPGRDAIIQAYAATQRYMCIASTSILVLAVVAVLLWRDINVKDFRKPKGATIV